MPRFVGKTDDGFFARSPQLLESALDKLSSCLNRISSLKASVDQLLEELPCMIVEVRQGGNLYGTIMDLTVAAVNSFNREVRCVKVQLKELASQLAPVAWIEISVTHAISKNQIFVLVPEGASFLDVRRAIAGKLGDDKVMRNGQLVKQSGASYITYKDAEKLGKRRRLLYIGTSLPRGPRCLLDGGERIEETADSSTTFATDSSPAPAAETDGVELPTAMPRNLADMTDNNELNDNIVGDTVDGQSIKPAPLVVPDSETIFLLLDEVDEIEEVTGAGTTSASKIHMGIRVCIGHRAVWQQLLAECSLGSGLEHLCKKYAADFNIGLRLLQQHRAEWADAEMAMPEQHLGPADLVNIVKNLVTEPLNILFWAERGRKKKDVSRIQAGIDFCMSDLSHSRNMLQIYDSPGWVQYWNCQIALLTNLLDLLRSGEAGERVMTIHPNEARLVKRLAEAPVVLELLEEVSARKDASKIQMSIEYCISEVGHANHMLLRSNRSRLVLYWSVRVAAMSSFLHHFRTI